MREKIASSFAGCLCMLAGLICYDGSLPVAANEGCCGGAKSVNPPSSALPATNNAEKARHDEAANWAKKIFDRHASAAKSAQRMPAESYPRMFNEGMNEMGCLLHIGPFAAGGGLDDDFTRDDFVQRMVLGTRLVNCKNLQQHNQQQQKQQRTSAVAAAANNAAAAAAAPDADGNNAEKNANMLRGFFHAV